VPILPAAPRAVLFDVGDTVLHEQWFDLTAGIAAVVPDSEQATQLAVAFRRDEAEGRAKHREHLLARWLREHVAVLSAMSTDAIENIIWERVIRLEPMPVVVQALGRLADDGIPMAGVSNAAFSGRVLQQELARHGLGGDLLRFVLSSADMNLRKPAVAVFEAAVDRLGSRAAETWFVGDTWDEDILGAAAAGLQPIWLSHGASNPDATAVPMVHDWSEFLILYSHCRAPAG
jgi:putative hydrolase of the HAD superfamily